MLSDSSAGRGRQRPAAGQDRLGAARRGHRSTRGRCAAGDDAGRGKSPVADDVDLPAARVVASRRHDLRRTTSATAAAGTSPPRGRTWSAGCGARPPPRTARGRQAAPSGLIASVTWRGLRVEAAPHRLDCRGVGDRRRAARARRQAAAHLGERAGAAMRRAWAAGRCTAGSGSSRAGPPPRPRPCAAIGTAQGSRRRLQYALDDRQPRPRLGCELDPAVTARGTSSVGCSAACARRSGAARVPRPRAAVAQMMPSTARGDADHLADPRAGLAGGEVGADPGAQVLRRADVEHGAGVVLEQVDARARGGAASARWRLRRWADVTRDEKVCSSSRVWTPRLPSRSISPCSTSTVARASDSARWLGVGAGAEQPRERRQLAVGRVVAGHHAAGELRRVEHLEPRPRRCRSARRSDFRKPTSNGALWATSTQPRANSRKAGSADSMRGALATIRVGDAGEDRDEGRDRLGRLDQGLELAEYLALADLDGADLGDRAAALRRSTRRLEVDDDERDVAERPAELVER